MRIATITMYNNMVNEVQDLDSTQNTLEGELATGLSITEPSDNPTQMSSVLGLVSQDQQSSQFAANANTALQIGQASYSGLTQLNSLSDSVDEIATEANNGTDSSDQLQEYATQIDQYLQQAVGLGNSQFEGNYIYAGTAVSQPPFQATVDPSTGEITGVTYAGNSSQAAIPDSSSSSVAPTTSGATNQSMADFMNQLVSLRDALQSGDSAGIASAQAQLSTSGDALISATAGSSAIQSSIQSQ